MLVLLLGTALSVLALGMGVGAMNSVSERVAAQANPAQEAKPFEQKQVLADLRKQIAGQEDKPSGEVFKNIRVPLFQKLPAKYLLGAMEFLFSKSIGVDCRHCHVVGQWEKDEKPAKQVGREMYALMLATQESLKKVSNLKSANPTVTCYTCHRGQPKPDIELPELRRK